MIPLDLDPRPALRQRFARAVRDGRPLDLDALIAQGVPEALAGRIVEESVRCVDTGASEATVDARVEQAVLIFGPVLATWFGVDDPAHHALRHPRNDPRLTERTSR
jgi:hypothetical protein